MKYLRRIHNDHIHAGRHSGIARAFTSLHCDDEIEVKCKRTRARARLGPLAPHRRPTIDKIIEKWIVLILITESEQKNAAELHKFTLNSNFKPDGYGYGSM